MICLQDHRRIAGSKRECGLHVLKKIPLKRLLATTFARIWPGR